MSVAEQDLITAMDLQVLSPEVKAEIERFRVEIADLEAGKTDPDSIKRFRLENGVYGIRGNPELHMVRVKIRFGKLNPEQIETLADIADRYTPARVAHVTTRQDVQFHNIARHEIPAVLAIINGCGVTTREACRNTVRNGTAFPHSGGLPTGAFDLTPKPAPLSQNLPST